METFLMEQYFPSILLPSYLRRLDLNCYDDSQMNLKGARYNSALISKSISISPHTLC